MAITEQFRLDGLRQLEGNLKVLREKFNVKTGGVIIRGMRAGARLIRDDARRRVGRIPSGYTPEVLGAGRRRKDGTTVRKGRKATAKNRQALLRSNIVEHAIPVSSRLAGGKPTVLIRVRNRGYSRVGGRLRFNQPGSSPGWWWWLEFGTSKQPAQPFMRPAVAARTGAALEEMKRTIAKEVEDTFAGHGRTLRRAA